MPRKAKEAPTVVVPEETEMEVEAEEKAAKRPAEATSRRSKKARVEPEPVDVRGKHDSHRTAHGVVMTFGMGDMGQLGYESEGRKKPKIVPDLEHLDVVSVECGGMHTAVLTRDGKVYTYGVNDEGALGRDGDELKPTVVGGELEGKHVIQIGCGDSHTIALTKDGVVYQWGIFRDAQGKFGLLPDHPKEVFKHPVVAPGLKGKVIVRIVSGGDHAMALDEDGKLYTWGCYEQGRLGRIPEKFSHRDLHKKCLTPAVVTIGKLRGASANRIVDIAAGSFHSFAITENKKKADLVKLYAWGANGKGQLGVDNPDEDDCNHYAPEEVTWLREHGVLPKQVAAGNAHSILLDRSHQIWATGKGTDGVLGVGSENHTLSEDGKNKWVHVSTLDGKQVKEVSCGAEVSYALTNEGEVYAWGFGENMQLGNGQGVDEETDSLLTPTLLEGQSLEDRQVLQISAGGQHVCLMATK